jgi:hypothetical protein
MLISQNTIALLDFFSCSIAVLVRLVSLDLVVITWCIQGMVNYINHDSKNRNVRIKWPDFELVAHKPDWLEKDVYFLRDTISKIGLSFEYVVTRDIQKGEEVRYEATTPLQ